LERTLDDKANRRFILPQAFLLSEELLRRASRILRGLEIYDGAVSRNLEVYGTFAATERLLMELVKAGADRQAMHELIREHSLVVWDAIREQGASPNLLAERLSADPAVLAFLPAAEVLVLLDAAGYVGDTPERACRLADGIRQAVGQVTSP
jgi:adenylosuccinate lyase